MYRTDTVDLSLFEPGQDGCCVFALLFFEQSNVSN